MCTHIYIYICYISLYICVCMYVYIYIYIYICDVSFNIEIQRSVCSISVVQFNVEHPHTNNNQRVASSLVVYFIVEIHIRNSLQIILQLLLSAPPRRRSELCV